MREIESAITAQARVVLKNRDLRVKSLLAWQNGKLEARDGEVLVEVDALGMHWWAVYPAACDRRKPAPAT